MVFNSLLQYFHMKYIFCLFLLTSLISCQNKPIPKSQGHQKEVGEYTHSWDISDELQLNKNRNDTTLWSTKNWNADAGDLSMKGAPMLQSVFPVPKYELIDNGFEGLGNGGSWKGVTCGEKDIIYHSLHVTKDHKNNDQSSEVTQEVYFTIAVLTDFIDTDRYSHTNVFSTSRNHPHYAGQGFIKTKENRVDFIAFLTEEKRAYAIVNMRLFDLRAGHIILIAPQKDGSLRSMQLTASKSTAEETEMYIDHMLATNDTVLRFFNAEGNI